ncbi:hypothetical protein [Halorientalis pallida]|uniref:CARDB protein n=1 Tax=Halorientalis pallida TaxID=2479928 RepID=A0A498KZE7_9EURY|nr:hypothetical protein [Halorientalis pallida]RXK51177.1 hypothetical protein EAF64_00595 [Halorientalis pallida]
MQWYHPVSLLVALVAVTAAVHPVVTDHGPDSVDAATVPTAGATEAQTNRSVGAVDTVDLTAPDRARIGTTVRVEGVLENAGSEPATRTVQFVMAGSRYARREVTLDPGERRTLTFEQNTMGIGLEPGQYYTGVLVGDRGEMTPLTLTRGFDIDEIDAPESVEVGETFTITASVKNYDDFEDRQRIEYRLDGEVLAATPLILDGTEEREIELRVDTDGTNPGTYVHGLVANGTGSHGTITIEPADEAE